MIGDGGFVGGGDLVKLVLLGCCNAVVYNWVHNKVRTRLGPGVARPRDVARHFSSTTRELSSTDALTTN